MLSEQPGWNPAEAKMAVEKEKSSETLSCLYKASFKLHSEETTSHKSGSWGCIRKFQTIWDSLLSLKMLVVA